MRSLHSWLAAFVALFVAYQAPQGIGGLWLGQPAIAAAMMVMFLPIAWLVARALDLKFAKAYALEWDQPALTWLIAGFLLALVAKGLALAIGVRLGIYTSALAGNATAGVSIGMLSWLALSTFIPSIAEDIVTRGFWARVPAISWTAARFVAVSSSIYVLNHIYRLQNGPAEWLMLFCFGLAYAAAFVRSGTLWAAVGLHWGWNFAGPAIDLAWPVEVLNMQSARLLSAAMHLVLLIIALWWLPQVLPRVQKRSAFSGTE